ncbi:ubiquitin-like-specific protease ESD4 isoform X2 [Abrus precatorius]|uniref:Ubiquitin-like-specific protease ESD4 isoform X2 n=1 Tax=Abrus precatorius TaxID=3816 RepID=A0A8B8M946_ABRPR|nr:ubiquitin-like-specific protease ESD4 isoform X2 [Abrus precatorius]
MGVMTSNRKRPEECMNVNHTNSDSHRKKPKLSTRPVSSSNNVVSRISRYPETKLPLAREVHAPCRPRKFELWRFRARASAGDDMGNALFGNYEKAKFSALSKCKFLSHKGKEVIDVDAESEEPRFRSYEVSGDSSVEEVVAVSDDDDDDLGDKVRVQQQSTSSLDSELTNGNLKVVSGGKVWGSEIHDLSSVHVYKKLLEAVGRRSDSIKRLDFEIKLNEKRRDTYNLLRPKKESVEEVPHEPFVSLTTEEEDEVKRAFSANWKKILVTHESSNIEITGEKFQCLRPTAWLNDEVINLYLELLKEREQREPRKFLKCHFFNTFFYKKLTSGNNGYEFKSVRRWTSQRKLGYGLLECDRIFVPIHQEIHWCLAVINKKEKKFQYLDSLKGRDSYALTVLARYFVDEVKDKTGKDIDVQTWEKEFVEDLPVQENGFDCGVFMIKYADFYSRGLGLCFNQEHMPYFRRRTAKEILRLKAE